MNTLGYSRRFLFCYTGKKGAEHMYEGIIRSFENLAHMNALPERWLVEEADPRVHGTVKEVVSERFEPSRVSRRLHIVRGWGHGKASEVTSGAPACV